MSYISGLSSIIKGERKELYFNKDQFLFATNFASNPYFADELNWARLALYYKDPTSQQRKIIILKDDNGRGWFAPSEMSRTGTWEVQKIEVYDKQGDFFVVERSNMPSPATFNIAVNRIVAPATPVISCLEGEELIIGGQFDAMYPVWTTTENATLTASLLEGTLANSQTIVQGNSMYAEQDSTVETGARYRASMLVPALTNVQNMFFETSYQMGAYDTVYSGVGPQTNKKMQVYFDAANTSVTTRFGLINLAAGSAAPGTRSVKVDNVSLVKAASELTLTMGQAINWRVGFKAKIWDLAANTWLSNDVYEIAEVQEGYLGLYDKLTLDKQIRGDYFGKMLTLRFPSYSECSGTQASLYQFVGSTY